MSANIQFVQTSPEELKELITSNLKLQLQEFLELYQPQKPKEYLSRNEVAKMLGIDLSTLHNWNKKKILNPVCIGARVYYLRSEVEASIKPINV
jgi:predicted DNA-binding transcriptional regulator AlpA